MNTWSIRMNWRKPVMFGLLYASGSRIPKNLREIAKYEYAGREELAKLGRTKLERLLFHAYNNVPYYRKVLDKCGLVKNEKVYLDRFCDVPILTKDIIRSEGSNLYSSDHKGRRSYENTSGGSTGEPIRLIQDAEYNDNNIATKLYFNTVLGKQPCEPEIKFWGSDRDIIEGNLTLKDRMINFLYNRRFFNSYHLHAGKINQLIDLNNRFKPVAYWSYMESALELANYLGEHDLPFHPPKFVISTIGPLTAEVREKIQAELKCRVYNQYGSREVGPIASECNQQNGLHTFPWWNHIEILDNNNRPVKPGQQGRVIVTTLLNYSMPLIRYDLGDVAVAGEHDCPCGRNTFKLQEIIGRTLGYFKQRDGSLVHSHFIVQALFFRTWIKRFQIVQDRFDHVLIKIELSQGKQAPEPDLKDIIAKTKILMGENCQVDIEFVDEITKTASGKYVYTLCKVGS